VSPRLTQPQEGGSSLRKRGSRLRPSPTQPEEAAASARALLSVKGARAGSWHRASTRSLLRADRPQRYGSVARAPRAVLEHRLTCIPGSRRGCCGACCRTTSGVRSPRFQQEILASGNETASEVLQGCEPLLASHSSLRSRPTLQSLKLAVELSLKLNT
jgi:hypothetical protein